MQVLDDGAVRTRLDVRGILVSVEAALRQVGNSRATQPKQVQVQLPEGAGDTIYYSAVSSSPALISVTVSPFLVARLAQGASPVTAYTLLLSGETGEAVALMESKSLIAARTGATTWIAARLLARRMDQIAIIGSGQVAEWHLRCMVDAPVDCIRIFSPRLGSAQCEGRRDQLRAIDSRVCFASSVSEAVKGAGVVMLCTASASPVLDIEDTPSDALITSITTDGPGAHEIDPQWLQSMDVYCDYRESSPSIAGEMQAARELYGWTEEKLIADLPELLRLAPLQLGEGQGLRRRYFRSVGLGIEDLAAAAAILGMPCK